MLVTMVPIASIRERRAALHLLHLLHLLHPLLPLLCLALVLGSCSQSINPNQGYVRFSSYSSLVRNAGTSTASFAYPRGIAVDAAGNIFVVDSANSRIVEMGGISGTTSTVFPTALTPSGDYFSSPEGIALDQTGNIWVADSGQGRIVHLNTADWQTATPTFDFCDTVRVAGIGYALSLPTGLAFSGHYLYVTDPGVDFPGNTARVFKIDVGAPFPASNVATGAAVFQSDSAHRLLWPRGIAVNPSGSKVYVSDEASYRIVMLDSALGGWTGLGTRGSGTGQFISPQTLAVDANDAIYVVDSANYWIVKMNDIGGSAWTTIGVQGGHEYDSVYPSWIAVGPAFNILVTDDVADEIVELR
jgi:DNA-binding beta-propeller fold protein YncE